MNFTDLESLLGIKFSNKNLLVEALTHRSYLHENPKNYSISNERLEFLGDSILSFVVSVFLFKKFKNFPEGKLTKIRSAIVREKTLFFVSKKLNLGNYLLLSKGEEEGGGRESASLLSDVFEALLAAVYLDKGLTKVSEFLENHLFPLIPQIIQDQSYNDHKSTLQELVQNKGFASPFYRVLKCAGPDHAKEFYMAVFINNKKEGEGKGKSKQEAEQKAAQVALEKFRSS